MYSVKFLFFANLIFVNVVYSKYAENSPCLRSDSECITESMKHLYDEVIKGNKALDIETSDPFSIDKVDGELATIRYTLTNNTLFGLKDCEFKSVELSEKNTYMTFSLYYPKTHFVGHYNVDGRLFDIPITGDGDYSFELYGYWIVIKADIKYTEESDGKTYASFQKLNIKADLKDGFDFKVDNLFNGNKEMADTFFSLVRQNWKLLIDSLQDIPLETGYKKLFKNINKALRNKPFDTIIQL